MGFYARNFTHPALVKRDYEYFIYNAYVSNVCLSVVLHHVRIEVLNLALHVIAVDCYYVIAVLNDTLK